MKVAVAVSVAAGLLLSVAGRARAHTRAPSSLSSDAGPPADIGEVTEETVALCAPLGREMTIRQCEDFHEGRVRPSAAMHAALIALAALDAGTCPECSVQNTLNNSKESPQKTNDAPVVERRPAAGSRRGGCVSCSTAEGEPGSSDASVIGLGLTVAAAFVRRRRVSARQGRRPAGERPRLT